MEMEMNLLKNFAVCVGSVVFVAGLVAIPTFYYSQNHKKQEEEVKKRKNKKIDKKIQNLLEGLDVTQKNVQIIFDDRSSIFVVKGLLTQCEGFQTMLNSDMKEGKEQMIYLSGYEKETFEKFRIILYTHSFPSKESIITEDSFIEWGKILTLCDMYFFEIGKNLIMEKMKDFLLRSCLPTLLQDISGQNIPLGPCLDTMIQTLAVEDIIQSKMNQFEPDPEIMGCFDTLAPGEHIRNPKFEFSLCCKHSFVFSSS